LADIHFLLPVLWLLLACAFTYAVLIMAYQEAKKDFDDQSAALRERLADVLQSNEAVLEGFSTLLGLMDGVDKVDKAKVDETKARRYAQQMRARYPHIFMLEIARKVPHGQLLAFEQSMVSAGVSGFQVRNFSHGGTRTWVALPVKPEYYPIVFIDPMTPQSEQVLGLDIDSVPFLSHALATSLRQGRFVASYPFKLIEGDWAYVMHRAVGSSPGLVALLVVKGGELLKSIEARPTPGLELNLWHRAFAEGDAQGMILRREGEKAGDLEIRFLPRLRGSWELGGTGQPFALVVQRQLRWMDFNLPLLAGVSFVNLALFVMLVWYVRARRRCEVEEHKRARQWAYLASHDPLTELPNRFLLMDRLEGVLLRAQREKTAFALIFMDVDRFKQVNDNFGHHAGDLVLKRVARAIQSALRAQDTVARISGDEFVVVLEKVADRAQVEAVGNKILAAMPASLGAEYFDLHIGLSLGIAMYPEDGSDVDTLLKLADAAMYGMKKRRGEGEDQGA
jgi:diguanylate cyclase (GGDEF)-like protein